VTDTYTAIKIVCFNRKQEATKMLQHEENELYELYPFLSQRSSSTPVGTLDAPPVAHPASEQGTSEPPRYPSGPLVAPPPPQKRPGRAGAIMLLTLVFAIILGLGLFAGW